MGERSETLKAEADRYNRMCGALSAEVERLEGLILDWMAQGFDPRSRAWAALWAEAKRIREARRWGK